MTSPRRRLGSSVPDPTLPPASTEIHPETPSCSDTADGPQTHGEDPPQAGSDASANTASAEPDQDSTWLPSEAVAPSAEDVVTQALPGGRPANHPLNRETAPRPTTVAEVGRTIDDFRLLRILGQGAFAKVMLAEQLSMQRLVALKISDGSTAESRTMARLDHPNIVRVFDQRQLPDDGPHLLYMQYLPGGTLADVLRRMDVVPREQWSGKMLLESVDTCLLAASQLVPERSAVRDWLARASWPTVVAWMGVQLGHALEAAHRQGVLHRDVKPANVLLSSEGIPKLADFNVSFADATQLSEGASAMGGSVAYMSPEHLCAIGYASFSDFGSRSGEQPAACNEDVRESADVYSMGLMLWELWQGERPFPDVPSTKGHADRLARQLARRREPPRAPRAPRSASERALEQTLRQALAPTPSQRPGSGGEFSARLRLALHPDAAAIFDPPPDGRLGRLQRFSPWWFAPAIILLPNIAAGCFNFAYNYREIILGHVGMRPGFEKLAMTVNAFAFPLGAALMIYFARPVIQAVATAAQGKVVPSAAIDTTLRLSQRAAWIGGALWLAAALIYPAVLSYWYPQFTPADALHFFGSLLVCGGVAMAYPFFGLTVLNTLVYYPKLVRQTMQDEAFDDRFDRLRRSCGRYLLTAAGVPLLGLALFLSRDSMAKDVVAVSVAATAVGLLAAWAAYQCVLTRWEQMADVLSRRRATIVPGADQEGR